MRSILITALAALIAALLLAGSASAASVDQVIGDCEDGSLSGNYTVDELQDARRNLPTDLDEYGNCRDLLRDAAADTGGGGTGGGSTGGGAGGGNDSGAAGEGSRRFDSGLEDSGSGAGTGSRSGAGSRSRSGGGDDLLKPANPVEQGLLFGARGNDIATIDGKPVQLGAGNAVSRVVTTLPRPVMAVLALVGILLLVAAGVTARGRFPRSAGATT